MTTRWVHLLISVLIASGAAAAALAPPAGLPEGLRGLPPKARQAAAAIQKAVQNQHDLIERAKQARTPEEREAIFRSIARNVRAIAQQRVAVLEEHTKLAKARVAWARQHADQVKVHDLVRAAVKQDTPGQPRSPFEPQDSPRSEKGPLPKGLAQLPASVAKARGTVEQSLARLEALREQAGKAQSDEERTAIRREIERHLKVVEEQRVAILEAALEISEKRLAWARKRAGQ